MQCIVCTIQGKHIHCTRGAFNGRTLHFHSKINTLRMRALWESYLRIPRNGRHIQRMSFEGTLKPALSISCCPNDCVHVPQAVCTKLYKEGKRSTLMHGKTIWVFWRCCQSKHFILQNRRSKQTNKQKDLVQCHYLYIYIFINTSQCVLRPHRWSRDVYEDKILHRVDVTSEIVWETNHIVLGRIFPIGKSVFQVSLKRRTVYF